MLSTRRDLVATRAFFARALAVGVRPTEVTTDRAPEYPRVLDKQLQAALHVVERNANNPIEADHSRLKTRLRPMRGLQQLRSAQTVSAGHAFVQNLRRGRYELATDEPSHDRVRVASNNSRRRSDNQSQGAHRIADRSTQRRPAEGHPVCRFEPCHHQAMLRSIEIRAVLNRVADHPEPHHLFFLPTLELSLDCFICQRVGRTTFLKTGDEQALCTSDKEHGRHPTAARVAAFDTTTQDTQLILRAVVDYWWAPFHDAKRDRQATAFSGWGRLYFHSDCPTHSDGKDHSTQSNEVRPSTTRCRHCNRAIAISNEAPSIRSLS